MNEIKAFLITIFLLACIVITASAEIWHDDFDAENTEAWKVVGNRRVWNVVDGMLRISINRDWAIEYDLYELIAFPAPHRDFVVTIKNFGADKLRFGFCVGRRFPETVDEDPFYYVFYPDEIRARRFNGRGSSHPFRYRLSREPRQRWDTDVIDEMELHFNSGFFLLFVDGEFRAKFTDANFNRIEILGFVVEGINIANQWEAEGWVDSFTISGLNVSPEVKATETWGEIKGN